MSGSTPVRSPLLNLDRRSFALLLIWAVGVLAYIVSIANRTSLAALGLDTAEHFSLDAATLSLFAVMQLAVYGVLQLPIGLLLDRLGPRIVLSGGMVILAASQTLLALAPDVPTAIVARVLLGVGDAAIFPSLLRVIGIRFPRRLAPIAVQITGLLGQAGQIISVVPFAALVRTAGWVLGFRSLAAVTVLCAILTWVVITERAQPLAQRMPLRALVAESWREPGTRLAFWVHFVTPFAGNAFAVLWGYPFLLNAEGVDRPLVEWMFTLYVLFGFIAGPIVGALSSRFAAHRVRLVVVLVALQAAPWITIMLLPGPAPIWLLIALALAMCLGGPSSLLAFDFAREDNPAYRLSTATGIVNGAGFLSSVLVILFIGVTLTALSGDSGDYGLEAFRWAELVQVPFWILGIAMVLRESRRRRIARAAA